MMENERLPAAQGRCQQLTADIRTHALGAREEKPHPVRVKHAVKCGKALVELRELLRHGDWNRWLEERCGLSRATASRYMRLAKVGSRLNRNMSIREAYIAAGVITPKRSKSKKSPAVH